MDIDPQLASIFEYIDEHESDYINMLKKAVSIPSVSARLPESLPEINKMIDYAAGLLEDIGATVERVDIGVEIKPDKSEMVLPNVLLGRIGKDFIKNTIILFNNLDVAQIVKSKDWITDPFVLTIKDEKMYGRGASASKGAVLCWINAIDAYKKLNIPFPVNVLFVLEGMGEVNNIGMEVLLKKLKEDVFYSADFICCSNSTWLGKSRPCMAYGLPGICRFVVEVKCLNKNLIKGEHSGVLPEPMIDLMYLLNSLTDLNGRILIKGIYDQVLPLNPDDLEAYTNMDFDLDEQREIFGVTQFIPTNKTEYLTIKWRQPSLTIHLVEPGSDSNVSNIQIIGKASAQFSIRIVPNQKPDLIQKRVLDHFNKIWERRKSPNILHIHMSEKSRPWIESGSHPHYQAVKRAVNCIYNSDPDSIQVGFRIPKMLFITPEIGKSAVVLPISSADDNLRHPNEKLNVANYIKGTKVMAAYFHEISKLC